MKEGKVRSLTAFVTGNLDGKTSSEFGREVKKQLKEIESGKTLEEIKENSSERKKFKRVALGGERGI